MTQSADNVKDFCSVFKALFRGRDDIIPRHWVRKDEKKSGYSPICSNEWKEGICKKPCRDCSNADYLPLSDALLQEHFNGKHILGIYPLLPDGTCWFIAADFDNHGEGNGGPPRDPLKDAVEFHAVCEAQAIPCYVERSKSGMGYHAWIFFSEAVAAWKARMVAFALLGEAGVIGEEQQTSSFDKVFPNQDAPSGKGYGNLIALPYQGKAAKEGHTLFLDPATGFTSPLPNQREVLQTAQLATEADLDRIVESWGLKQDAEAWWNAGTSGGAEGQAGKKSAILDCAFIKWCEHSPGNVPEPLWYAMLSNVARVTGGPSLCHEISRWHPKYTRQETDAKILQALDRSGPHTCAWIRKNGYDCIHECKVKSPAGLAAHEGIVDAAEDTPCYANAILEAEDFCRLDIPEKRVYLHPWLLEKTIFFITAWRGIGKTGFILGILDALTKGEGFGPWTCEESPNVVYIDGEMPATDVVRRLQDLGTGNRRSKFYVYSDDYAHGLGLPKANLTDASWQEGIKKWMLERDVKVLVLDNLASLCGGIDENSRQEWDPIGKFIVGLRHDGIATGIVHHTGKGGDQRGTSAREDHADSVIALKKPTNYRADQGARFIASFTKSRIPMEHLALVEDAEFQLSQTIGDTFEWTWKRVSDDLRRQILRNLDEGISQIDIAKLLETTRGYVSKIRAQAIKAGWLTEKNELTQEGFRHVGKNDQF